MVAASSAAAAVEAPAVAAVVISADDLSWTAAAVACDSEVEEVAASIPAVSDVLSEIG